MREPQAACDPAHAGSRGEDLEMKLETQSSHCTAALIEAPKLFTVSPASLAQALAGLWRP